MNAQVDTHLSVVALPSGLLRVLEPGVANAVQDTGRTAHLAIGVPRGGAADGVLLACANRLLGNADDAAALELPLVGPTLEVVRGEVAVALAGAVQATVERLDGQRLKLTSFVGCVLQAGERLRVAAVRRGVAYLAVSGGVQVPMALGSRATYARAGLGGVQGRLLQAGDELPCSTPTPIVMAGPAFEHAVGPVGLMAGPQQDAFTPEAWQTLLQTRWVVSRQSDRMGLRLVPEQGARDAPPEQGANHAPAEPRLVHTHGADLCSEGVVPGSIQVPLDGLPIVLMVDAQTVGGYPKIATVIRADLPRLAHLRAGQALAFTAVDLAAALDAYGTLQSSLATWTQALRPASVLDGSHANDSTDQAAIALPSAWLLSHNLVSGMMDAHADPVSSP
jgi:5-oxoprolinase (ATP-hydrolysing) subunit C